MVVRLLHASSRKEASRAARGLASTSALADPCTTRSLHIALNLRLRFIDAPLPLPQVLNTPHPIPLGAVAAQEPADLPPRLRELPAHLDVQKVGLERPSPRLDVRSLALQELGERHRRARAEQLEERVLVVLVRARDWEAAV